MQEVIWFFGPSAVGKKTLIEALEKDTGPLKSKIGIASDGVCICRESLEWVTKKNHDARPVLIKSIVKILDADPGAKVLVKGQTFDLKQGLLESLQKAKPEVKQRIVFLHVDPEEGMRRIKANRHWYEESMGTDYFVHEIQYELGLIDELSLDVPITYIYSDPDYAVTERPDF